MSQISVLLVLVLTSLTLADIELLIDSSYPIEGNYSYIELQCVDNASHTAVAGASFQLNGTDIEQDISDSIFILTQEKEGFFTCSFNGSYSYNAIGLAGNTAWLYPPWHMQGVRNKLRTFITR